MSIRKGQLFGRAGAWPESIKKGSTNTHYCPKERRSFKHPLAERRSHQTAGSYQSRWEEAALPGERSSGERGPRRKNRSTRQRACKKKKPSTEGDIKKGKKSDHGFDHFEAVYRGETTSYPIKEKKFPRLQRTTGKGFGWDAAAVGK